MSDDEKRAIMDVAWEMLWLSKVYNDHNFTPDIILEKARALTDLLKIDTTDQANEFNDRLLIQMNK